MDRASRQNIALSYMTSSSCTSVLSLRPILEFMYSDEALKLIESRRSIRSYKPDMVPDDLIDKVIEAGTFAATGGGRQSPIIIAVKDRKTRDKLSKLNADIMGAETDPRYGAPLVLIVLADRSSSTYLYDGSLVMGNLMLAAHALGLGSCWIHRAKEEFDRPEGKEILKDLGITGDYEGIGHCILGYIDGDSIYCFHSQDR